jgi:hypothetical protein
MIRTKKNRKGFTIIELMLAMGFLSALLVVIALLIVQITGIYQKGLSLRAISSEGKQLIDEFSRVVGGSPITDVSLKSGAPEVKGNLLILGDYFVSRNGADNNGARVQHNGTFCTGSYSYIWNTQYSYSGGLGTKMTINGETFKLARVSDSTKDICSQSSGTKSGLNGIGITGLTISDKPIELISSDESDLILYDFTVFPATQNTITGQTFYSATFILATIRGGVNIHSGGDFCKVDEGSTFGLSSDFNYCAVNKFNFAMRATGYTEGEDQYGERGAD